MDRDFAMIDRRSLVLLTLGFSLLASRAGLAQQAMALPLMGRGFDGQEINPEAVSGWKLVYFGYTQCPDVCPMGLHTMSETLKLLGPLGERIRPVFVTVDPDRDTPAVMKEYTSYFDPRFVGLSPSAEQLATMTAAWRIKFAKVPGVNGGPYTVDHTSSILLANPAGMVTGRFPHSLDPDQMANKIRSVFLRG